MRQISAAVFGGWVLGMAVLACSGTDGSDLFPSSAEGTKPKAGERAPSDEVTNGGGDDGGGGDGGTFRFDGNHGGAGGAGAEGAAPTPTWTELYSRYFGPNTPGHCGRCHRNGCELNKNACYQWFARKKQFPLQTSRLTWFGGDMPKDNLAPNPQAELDMTAWQTSGGENN